MYFSFRLSGVFLMVRLGFWVSRIKTTEVKCSHLVRSRVSGSYMRCSWEPKYLPEGVPLRFPPKVTTLACAHTGSRSLSVAHTEGRGEATSLCGGASQRVVL